ncbi:MAG: efflux RND transporter periplasmic adaptor subunit [Planctomycetota bacterium]
MKPTPGNERSTRTGRRAFLLCLPIFPLLAIAGAPGEKSKGGDRPVPVTIAQVVQKRMTVDVASFGTVEANATVTLRPQITGPIVEAHFREGQDVKKGDLLFTIDPKPSELSLQRAEASLTGAKSQLANALRDVARLKELVEKGAVSQGDFDNARTNADALSATVQSSAAAVESAKLDLGYCRIRSPLDGRIGARLSDPGNIVKENETALAVIHQIRPIQASFGLPQQYLREIHARMSASKLSVRAFPTGDDATAEMGELTFVDNAVDAATGTIRLKATFPNSTSRLWPGQFVRVSLTLREEPGAIVVPARAVQIGQAGPYAFVVKDNSTVESRPLVVNRANELEAVIDSGLEPGERVVTEGHLLLVPGSKVEDKGALPGPGKAPKDVSPGGRKAGGRTSSPRPQ